MDSTDRVERNAVMGEKLPWDVDCDATRVGMERFLRALVCTRSHFTDSFSLAPVVKPSRVTVFFRVWIPTGSEQRFLELAQVDELKPPQRVSVGMDRPTEPLRETIRRVKPD
jgi:hypothetical protein